MRIGAYDTHPIADALPLMDDHRLESLADDIKANGLRRPIVLHEGLILDGRNRGLACELAKVEPRYEEFAGDDPIRFVWSENGERRDLSDGARALVVKRLNKLRMVMNKQLEKNRKQAALPIRDKEVDHLVQHVVANGTPELVTAMEQGALTAAVAAEVADLPDAQQREWLQPKETKPQRAAVVGAATMESVAMKLSPVDAVALRAGLIVLERSIHAEVNAAAALVRRMVPWV